MTDHIPRNVIVVISAGLIDQAIARRVGPGKYVVLAGLHQTSYRYYVHKQATTPVV